MAGPRVEIVVRVSEAIRERLLEMAEDREESLTHFCAELLEVAAVEKKQDLRAEEFHRSSSPSDLSRA